MKLVKLAGLTADADTNQAFVHGLLPHIKMQVIMQDKVELKDVLEAAISAEIAFRETGETSLAATTITETTKMEVKNEQETTSDNQTIKVLMELLGSVVKATIGKTASTTFTAPSIIRESTTVQLIEQQPEPDQGRQHRNAQNWIGQSRDTLPRRQQQSWHPQQQPQPQQQHSNRINNNLNRIDSNNKIYNRDNILNRVNDPRIGNQDKNTTHNNHYRIGKQEGSNYNTDNKDNNHSKTVVAIADVSIHQDERIVGWYKNRATLVESWDTATECVDLQMDNNKPDNTDNQGLREGDNHLNKNSRTVLLHILGI